MLFNTLPFFIVWLLLSLFLVLLLSLASYLLSSKNKEEEKLTSYECGFDPFDGSRAKFDIHFFIVAIMFLLFDLEIIFFFPLTLTLHSITSISFLYFNLFFWVVFGGFVYEWSKGALTWVN